MYFKMAQNPQPLYRRTNFNIIVNTNVTVDVIEKSDEEDEVKGKAEILFLSTLYSL